MTYQQSDAGRAGDLLAKVFGNGVTAGDTGSHFTCGEADTIAEALRLLGQDEAAETFLNGHAQGDDQDDTHHDRIGNTVTVR